MSHADDVLRKPSLSSALLGVVALTLAGVVIGRVDANANGTPADFTPVVITPIANLDPTPKAPQKATQKPVQKPAQTPAQTTAPKPDNTTRTFTQITPTPRDISDDDDNGGQASDNGSDDTSDSDDPSDDTSDNSGSGSGSDDTSGSDSTVHH